MSEAQDRLIWLHDAMQFSDARIAEYLNITRTGVCRIRNGEYGYSGKSILHLLRSIKPIERNGIKYSFPNCPPRRKRYSPPAYQKRCQVCQLVKRELLPIENYQTRQLMHICKDCYEHHGRE